MATLRVSFCAGSVLAGHRWWRFLGPPVGLLVGLAAAVSLEIVGVLQTSMTPTLEPGGHVIALRLMPMTLLSGRPPYMLVKPGDIVLIDGPLSSGRLLKRVVAKGGDSVQIREGIVFVNGIPSAENHAHHSSAALRRADNWPGEPSGPIRIPSQSVFVLGDNRSESADSRLWGAVPAASVSGLVLLSLPF